MKKPTLATVKSFIRKNADRLMIKNNSNFDGMIDGLAFNQNAAFRPVTVDSNLHKNTLGVNGAWFVFGSRDWITHYSANGMVGFEIYNSCGNFVIAVKE